MLYLNRNVHPYEVYRCDVSREPIGYLDYYYEDDEDGLIVKFEIYHALKRENEIDKWDWNKLNLLANQKEYEMAVRAYEKFIKSQDVLEREVYKGE